MTDQPQRQWNGQQWFTWDGTQWVPDPVQVPPAGVQPQVLVPQKKGHGCLIAFVIGVVALLIIMAIVVVAIIAVSRSASSIGKKAVTGIVTKDARGDVVVAKTVTFDAAGIAHVKITVTNHSSKSSDYIIEVAASSADGSTQYDTGTAIVQGLEPGQKTTQDVSLLDLTKAQANDAKLSLKTVLRTASR